MKKEIRLYFNLEKEDHKKAYNFLYNSSSASKCVIDLIDKKISTDTDKNIIASKLDLLVEAITKIQILQNNNLPIEKNIESEILLNLNDHFDDDY